MKFEMNSYNYRPFIMVDDFFTFLSCIFVKLLVFRKNKNNNRKRSGEIHEYVCVKIIPRVIIHSNYLCIRICGNAAMEQEDSHACVLCNQVFMLRRVLLSN
jgi:hypothetical protein